MAHSLEKVPRKVYEDRRRVVAALLLTVIATVADAFSSNGTGWPFLPTLGFFFIMTTGPLAIAKLLNIVGEAHD